MVVKKKRGHPDIEEVLARPWCYYCERDFDDLKILISHQKAKHFKCERCGRRLNTAGGLSVHMNQVHKETLTTVENALGNRAGLDVEIFGVEGIPEDVVQAHNQRIITAFYQAEAERNAQNGSGGNGGAQGVTKKPKLETPAEMKKRLAEHKARMAEKAAGGGDSREITPALKPESPAVQSPAAFNGSPYGAQPAVPVNYAQPQGANYGAYPQEPYAQPPAAYPQPYAAQPAYSPPAQFAPPGQYPPQPFAPQQFPPGPYQQHPPPFPGNLPPPQYGQPPPHFQGLPVQGPPLGMLPNRPTGLPQPPGLPQRPSFSGPPGPPGPHFAGRGGPQIGGWNGNNNGWNGPPPQQNPAMSSAYPNPRANAPVGDDIDEIIRMAEAGIRPAKRGDAPPGYNAAPAAQAPAGAYSNNAPLEAASQDAQPISAVATVTEVKESTEKKSKKDKDKNNKMIYSDNDVSPEEKMAKLLRYAFVPEQKEETTLVDAQYAPVTTEVVAA